jgi:phosphotransferase system  glucose/maltose/N-acetylglucosamine-specific IIC component
LTCGYEYKTDIVKASGHSLETKVLLVSTCEEKGERYYGCTKCDYERIDEIPEHGHNYELSEETSTDGMITRVYVCTLCAQSFEQDMGEQYEKVSNYVEYLFDEYSPYMMWVFLATAGVWSIAMGIAIIIATKNEDKAKAKKMLVNYGIGLIVIFTILVAAPYLVHGIAALIS